MAYLPLSTANLPDPVIDPAQGASPADHFNTVIYTGNSLNPASVTGVGFQPDFVWAKTRSFGNTNHRLQDAVRGSNKRLASDLTSAETDAAGGIQSFDADGFTVGDGTSKDGFIHFGGRTFVAWNWKANGSGVTNTDGSITSTVSANTTSGFSIVSYTGNGVLDASIGHGLDSAPEFIIIKNRDASTNWPVYTTAIDGGLDLGYLNLTNTFGGSTQTLPTTSVFHVSNHANFNANTQDYIAYCFHSVEGFSKFGSYVGNGSADGPFIYLGFRPAFLIYKQITDAAKPWYTVDSTRDVDNEVEHVLFPNSSDAENSSHGNKIDFCSNGFKIRNTGSTSNASGKTFIYMAFAENPFKYSNAR